MEAGNVSEPLAELGHVITSNGASESQLLHYRVLEWNRESIIWSLSLGAGVDPPVYLRAFDPETGNLTQPMNQLFNGTAGNWNSTSRAFLVPVVADGKVFVATYAQLAIFGLNQ